MDEVDLLVEIVSTMVKGLSIPVTCKVRIYKDYDRTINLCEALVNAGASLLTVHGRTREEKGQLVREPDWQTIARIKQHFANRAVPIPIIANGGIECLEDIERCIAVTGADGVMSSEGILENPALFCGGVNSLGVRLTQLQMAGMLYNHISRVVRTFDSQEFLRNEASLDSEVGEITQDAPSDCALYCRVIQRSTCTTASSTPCTT
jgi:tRNA-dihydrouridine synthase